MTRTTNSQLTAPSQHRRRPYYFIAIHNEPAHGELSNPERLVGSYEVLREMIRRADSYNIRLTLMFTAQWVALYADNAERQAELQRWRERGHEIAAHHHSIYHGNWDGYTDFPEEEAEAQRIAKGKKPEPYLGTLSDDAIDPKKGQNEYVAVGAAEKHQPLPRRLHIMTGCPHEPTHQKVEEGRTLKVRHFNAWLRVFITDIEELGPRRSG